MKITPVNQKEQPIGDASSSFAIASNLMSRLSNTKPSEEPLTSNGTNFHTGRGLCIDSICSLKTLIMCFLITSLFITCLVIWIILMILASQQVEISMGIASIVVWCTFVVSLIVFSIAASLGISSLIRKPLRDLTRELFVMKSLRFDSVKKLKSILYEFIPLFTVFFHLNGIMQEIRPFIPESITQQSYDDEEELEREQKEEERKQFHMMALRKSIFSASSAGFNPSVVINVGKANQDKKGGESHSIQPPPLSTVSKTVPPQANSSTSPNPMVNSASVAKLRKAVSKVGVVVALSKARKSVAMEGTLHGHDSTSDHGSASAGNKESNLTGGFSPQISTNLGLGLTSHITTIIIIQFRNFDGNTYPNPADLLSVFTLLFQKVQSASRQYKGKCSIVTPKVLMISFEVGRNVERNALLCALQLEKQMQAINSQLSEQVNLPQIEFGIGVSRSECLVGNVGTAAVRFAALIGSCSSNALRLAALCAYFGTSILTDESLALPLQTGFITRAVHFMQKKSIFDSEKLSLDDGGDDRQVIFQLLGENRVNDDEWLYELEQQENNNKYKEFDQAFGLLRGDVNISLLGEICEVFGSYSSKNPNDRVVSLLYTQLSDYLKLDTKEVEQAVRSFSLEKTSIPLHTDPSFIL